MPDDTNGSTGSESPSIHDQISLLTNLVTQLTKLQLSQQAGSSNRPPRFTFESYNLNSPELLDDYLDRFKLQLGQCKVPQEEWAANLRIHMGAELNSTLRDLAYPSKVDSLSFDVICSMLIDHFVKKKNKYTEAINFRKVFQKDGEKVHEFAARLKAAARFCKFDDFLNYSLIVQFIHGVLDDDIRDEIITKQPDQFEEALKIAQALEASQEASSHLKPNQPATVHKFYDSKPKVKKKQSSNFRSKSQHRSNQGNKPNFSSDKQSSTQPNQRKFINVSCRSCNVEHERRNCRYRRSRCNYCKHVGHLLEVCGKKPTNNINFQETEYPDTGISYFGASIHKVSSTDESILNAPPPPTFLEVYINDQLIKME